MTATSETFERAPGHVWRLAHDRLLLRRIGARDPHAMVEVVGDALLVWVALDEPGTCAEVSARLGADDVVVRSALADAVGAGIVRVRQTTPPGENDHG
ncbi:MAG: hypothetical protein ACOYMR_03615 [Ilumatobacteraceae bacterium]